MFPRTRLSVRREHWLVPRSPQQRLAANGDDQDAQEPRHVLSWSRDLARLEDVVEEQNVHSEESGDQEGIDSASHASIVDRPMCVKAALSQCSEMTPDLAQDVNAGANSNGPATDGVHA